jgi:hypothetical protein
MNKHTENVTLLSLFDSLGKIYEEHDSPGARGLPEILAGG